MFKGAFLAAEKRKNRLKILALGALLVPFLLVAGAKAEIFVQGFSAKGTIKPGNLVALDSGSATTVVLAPSYDSTRVYGVVIDQSQAAVTLNGSGKQVFVATAGDYPVLVIAKDAQIKVGDYISISRLDGIGGKATVDQSAVLGRAMQGFDGIHNVVDHQKNIAVGRITVNINPSKNPDFTSQIGVPSQLRRLGNTVAGRAVPPSRIYTALVIFVVATLLAGGLLWVGVRNSLTALGRNPLSRHSIMIGLVQVLIMGVAVFIIGLLGVYLLLRL